MVRLSVAIKFDLKFIDIFLEKQNSKKGGEKVLEKFWTKFLKISFST